MATSFRHRVLCEMQGSGPMGRSASSAFYTLVEHPECLTLKTAHRSAVRRDIDIGRGGLAFIIDNVLTEEESDSLVALTESIGYSRYAPGIRTPPGMRQNLAAHWFAPRETIDKFVDPMFKRFQHLLPESIEEGDRLYPGLSHRFAHYKYNSGDVFNKHTDGSWPGQSVNKAGNGVESWDGYDSKLSMVLYLSDHSENEGGATRLYRFDGLEPVDVAPKKGSALFFRHGFGPNSVLHAGMQLHGENPKYVCRLNVLYGDNREQDITFKTSSLCSS